MSFYEPTVIASGDYNIARRPSFGGEMKVYLSSDEVYEMGSLALTDSGTATWTADTVNAAILSADPSDLQVQVEAQVESAVNVVVTVTGTDQTGAALTGTATIKPPAWVTNQTNDFPEGYAVDVTPGTGGKLFKTITGVTVAAGGGARGSKMRIFKLPASTSYSLVGCTTSKDFTTSTRPPKSIACGLKGSAFVKFGRSDVGSLNITGKYVSYAEGLQRFSGRRCTAKAVLEKEEQLTTEVLVFGNYVPRVKPSFGDGDEEATGTAEGEYESFFAFVAK